MKRSINIIAILIISCVPVIAQTSDKNYVMTETMLDAEGTRKVASVQYYDGLGRPSELAAGGISTGGRYLHTLQTYDALGREEAVTLPAVGTTASEFKGMTLDDNLLTSTYSDSRAYSQTTYDALGRPTFISTPGQNWLDKGKSIEYITNGANEVKKYKVFANSVVMEGYYPAGTLTGERISDEDGVTVTTFKDLLGRIILERRGTGGDTDDTYYVYSRTGLLRFVLQPMYQQNAIGSYSFRYDYDSRGRMTYKHLPGCDAISYWYDSADRVIATREPSRGSTSCYRYYYYDGLGRLVVQGRSSASASNADTPIITTRTQVGGTAEIAGTGYFVNASRIPANFQLEIVNYYDDYTFLSGGLFAELASGYDFDIGTPNRATTLPTGTITTTSDSHFLAKVICYDERGRVSETRETLLGGDFLRTETEYSFTDKPVSAQKTLSTSIRDFEVKEQFTYDDATDQLLYQDVSFGRNTARVLTNVYDELGRVSQEKRHANKITLDYDYNIQGWLKSICASGLSSGTQLRTFYYEDAADNPCYNGNISAMTKKVGIYAGTGFKYQYDDRNRLTASTPTDFSLTTEKTSRAERMSYDRNSSLTMLTRTDDKGRLVDSLEYNYNGNRLASITDYGTSSTSFGALDFVGQTSDNTYAYNAAGDLTQDGNKGLTKIEYDYLGHPARIQFRNGNCTEYVYAADGRKLRELHTTAVSGITVPMGQSLTLTPAQTMCVDSVCYVDNMELRYMGLPPVESWPDIYYRFAGGYMAIRPTLDSYTVNSVSESSLQSTTSEQSTSTPTTPPAPTGPPPPDPPEPPVPTPDDFYYAPSYFYYVRDHQGNNVLTVDSNGATENSHNYYAGGLPWSYIYITPTDTHSYNDKEFDHIHGLDWYDYGARRYDPAFCQFTQIDPLAEQYYHLNPYTYCAGNPVNAIDQDGKLIIFINGFAPKMDGGTRHYWPKSFISGIMSHFNESREPIFRDGSVGAYFGLFKPSNNMAESSINPLYRIMAGYSQGMLDAERMVKSLSRDEKGEINETVRLVTHSMGGAYAKGYAQALVKYIKKNPNLTSGISITEYDFAPFQPSLQFAVQGVDTYQYSHLFDPVAKYMPVWGATMMPTKNSIWKGHSIDSFLEYISKLPEGTYKFINGELIEQ